MSQHESFEVRHKELVCLSLALGGHVLTASKHTVEFQKKCRSHATFAVPYYIGTDGVEHLRRRHATLYGKLEELSDVHGLSTTFCGYTRTHDCWERVNRKGNVGESLSTESNDIEATFGSRRTHNIAQLTSRDVCSRRIQWLRWFDSPCNILHSQFCRLTVRTRCLHFLQPPKDSAFEQEHREKHLPFICTREPCWLACGL